MASAEREDAIGGTAEAFLRRVAAAPQRALLLDYDGTLAPFRAERGAAVPYPGVREALDHIQAAGRTRVVVVTGRPAHVLVPLLGLRRRVEVWGCHGWERLGADGSYEPPPLSPAAAEALARARAWGEERGWAEHLEPKPCGLALHWRGVPPETQAAMRAAAQGAWPALAAAGGLEMHGFDGGLELRLRGRDKGTAVAAILAELGEGAAVAFLGDDATDEDGFRALKGKGLGILVRREYRATAAEAWLVPPEGLLAFLGRWSRAAGGEA